MNLEKIRIAACAATLTLLALPLTAAAGPLRFDLQFGDEYVLNPPTTTAPNGAPRPRLSFLTPEGVLRRRDLTVDTGSRYRAWLHEEVAATDNDDSCLPICAEGRSALAFQLTNAGTAGDHVKEKVMMPLTDPKNIAGTEIPMWTSTPRPRYVSFDFKVDPAFQLSDMDMFTIHFQLLQGGGHPVFTMETQRNPNGELDLVFYYTNDETEELFRCIDGNRWDYDLYRVEFHRVRNIARDEWKKYVFEFIPPHGGTDPAANPLNPGRIAVDVGGTGQFVATNGVFWGYKANPALLPYTNVDSNCGWVNRPQATLKGSIGIYRPRETAVHTVYFDNVRFGTTLEAVTAS